MTVSLALGLQGTVSLPNTPGPVMVVGPPAGFCWKTSFTALGGAAATEAAAASKECQRMVNVSVTLPRCAARTAAWSCLDFGSF